VLCAFCNLCCAAILPGKFHTLRGVLEDHHLERANFARRTPMKVALACAVATSIITYFLYKVYIDSMLRRRELDEDEIEQLAKAADKREAAKIKKEPPTPIEKVKERKRPERKGEDTGCCYNGLLRLGRGKATASKPAAASPTEATSPALKRPDFSGTWSCVKAEGDLDGLYAAMGLGYFARCAMERAQWGAGQLSRTYEQQGTHVKLVQRATEETTQEFDITGTPQKEPRPKLARCCQAIRAWVSQGDGVVIQTTSWDEREEGVLLFETKDLLGNNPNSWTTSRQYLKGDELIIEVLGARGHQAVWTYHRG